MFGISTPYPRSPGSSPLTFWVFDPIKKVGTDNSHFFFKEFALFSFIWQ